jgi:hypothetical protein
MTLKEQLAEFKSALEALKELLPVLRRYSRR